MSAGDLPRKLNYGCGYDKRAGYVNVDMYAGCAPDVLIVDNDLSVLPKHWFDEVLALDVLEHIPRLDTQAMLLEWADLLRDGGALVLKTSSILGVAERVHHNERSFREQFGWTQCLFGTQTHEGDFHYTGFTETTLGVQLLAAGFAVERMWMTDNWLLHATASKTSSWTRLLDSAADATDEEFVVRAYREALGRDPEPYSLDHLSQQLASGGIDRRAVLLHVHRSPERLFAVAERHGYDQVRREPLESRVARRVPEQLKPALRRARTGARRTSARARRALGTLRAERARHT